MLKYVGRINPHDPADRDALHGVPARDLTDAEVGNRRKELLASKLYVEDTPSRADLAEKAKPDAAKGEKAPE